jgi:hypothetical protein
MIINNNNNNNHNNYDNINNNNTTNFITTDRAACDSFFLVNCYKICSIITIKISTIYFILNKSCFQCTLFEFYINKKYVTFSMYFTLKDTAS